MPSSSSRWSSSPTPTSKPLKTFFRQDEPGGTSLVDEVKGMVAESSAQVKEEGYVPTKNASRYKGEVHAASKAALKHGLIEPDILNKEHRRGRRKEGSEEKFFKICDEIPDQHLFGPRCRYVLVPKKWSPRPGSEPVEQIFKGLGLELPSLLFRYSKSGKTLPDNVGLKLWTKGEGEEGGEEGSGTDKVGEYELIYEDATKDQISFFKLMMDSQLTAFCSILGAACAEVNAYYVLDKCKMTNEFCCKLLDNLPSNGVAVGICEMFLDHYETYWMSDQVKEAIRDCAVPIEEEVQHTVKWASKLTPTLKHVILFEHEKEKEDFLNDLAR